ncbi:exported hypothetical protein [Bacillus licheniformis]
MKLFLFRSSSVVELSAVNRSVAGSNPACGANASIAQQVEHFHGKEEVSGSSPLGSLSEYVDMTRFLLLWGKLFLFLRYFAFRLIECIKAG